jgi:hypothetical protein
MKNATKTLLIAAALLAPAASVMAADDGFAGYQRGILGVAASPAQAGTAGAAMACGHDPFDGYHRGVATGGPAQVCGDMAAGAQGPAGPTLTSAWADPFEGYQRGILGAKY